MPTSQRLLIAVSLVLLIATLAIYARTLGYGFVAYDDNKYVYENPVLRAGLTASNFRWAFTTFYFANWCPLTWISYFADVQFFGVNAGEMHAVNVALHGLTTLLLFLALVRLTRQPWRCALVAGLFAVHPVHVQSVAWIADRKDLLSAMFAALALFLYTGYAKAPSALRYLSVALAFTLSVMAKTIVVTLPFVLLLVDFWPLRRFSRRAVLEKVPLIAIAAGAGALTLLAQRKAMELSAVGAFDHVSLLARVANALVCYVRYMAQVIWPAGLSVFYPAEPPSVARSLGAAAILVAITLAAAKWARRRPFLLVGWLWYLGMLLPVIGILQQVGDQNFADRYDYLPMIGLSIAAVWTVADAIAHRPAMQRTVAILSVLWLAGLAVAAAHETEYWADSRTLFAHGLSVTKKNYLLANDLGVVLEKSGQSADAAGLFRRALEYNPSHAPAHVNLGLDLLRSGHFEEGSAHLAEAVRLNPKLPMAQAAVGVMLAGEGNSEEALRRFEDSLRLDPDQAEAQNNTCALLLRLGRTDEATAHCARALSVRPEYAMARINIARAFAMQGRQADAERELNRVLREDPSNATARQSLLDLRNGRLR